MNLYKYNDLKIELFDEHTNIYGSSDNDFNYSKIYFSDEKSEFLPSSKHGIKIYQNDKLIDNCIIIGWGGATSINQNSSIIDKDKLLICCGDSIFCLKLKDLVLEWKIKADEITCFQLFKLQNDYIVHGECYITRLDNNGKIKWQFRGADIFVSINGKLEFKLEENYILLTDFQNTKYKINFDGKLI